ncbi:hypothetical protein BK671_10495 [Pseudomonas fluorescens]|uniref:TM2 domain-containing protein n=1 Tax=Pseudomonas fluorescens TaxID=294 RepID=A0A423LNE7_PSEFL|nr:hypothetical protein BK671_10495 [Pseudomonas fluorescens]
MKSKSVAVAIGLNLIFPGFGYLYMCRYLIGIFGGLLVFVAMCRSSESIALVWVVMNLIMAIDMCLLKGLVKNHE